MVTETIPEEIKNFIRGAIHSVEQLEVLLFLHRSPLHRFGVEEIRRVLSSTDASIAQRLEGLCAQGLCEKNAEGTYCYSDAKIGRATIDGVAKAYRESRARVIDLIFSDPVDKIRDFANAFRWRKDRNG